MDHHTDIDKPDSVHKPSRRQFMKGGAALAAGTAALRSSGAWALS